MLCYLWPLISATSVMPPTLNRKYSLLRARAMERAMEVFPTPGESFPSSFHLSVTPHVLMTVRSSFPTSLSLFASLFSLISTLFCSGLFPAFSLSLSLSLPVSLILPLPLSLSLSLSLFSLLHCLYQLHFQQFLI